MSVFAIGDENTILGFSLIGVSGQIVRTVGEARSALDDAVARDDVKIVLITENWAAEMREKVDQLKKDIPQPLVLDIPGSEPAAKGRSLREFVQEAVGIRLHHGGGE